MDFQELMIGGVGVLFLVFGIVEQAKAFGVEGKASRVLQLALGFLFVGVGVAIEGGMIPAEVVPYIELIVKGIGGALAAGGVFEFMDKRLQRA